MQLSVNSVKSASNSEPLYLQSGLNDQSGAIVFGSNGTVVLSGNMIVPRSKFNVWAPASAWTPSAAGITAATANSNVIIANNVTTTLDFGPDTDSAATYVLPMPKGWNGSRIVPSVFHYWGGVGNNQVGILNVVMSVMSKDAINGNMDVNAVRLIFDANKHPTRNYLVTQLTSTVNSNTNMKVSVMTGYSQEADLTYAKYLNSEKMLLVSLWRDANDAGDTATGILKVIGVEFTYEVDSIFDS
jgi:hypothetical protein